MVTPALASAADTKAAAPTMAYRTVEIDGSKIAYREIGSHDKPTILLLHGVPSSSRMYDDLMKRLGNEYHLVAPDYPGFGNSDAPSPRDYAYTFDHLAETVIKLTDALKLDRYVLFMQDYGAPIGMRVAIARPQSVMGTIFQNGNVYEEGLGPMWEKRKAFWNNRSELQPEVVKQQQSLAVTRARHLGTDPNIEAYNPDLWMDEYAYLNRPGQDQIQSDLIFDYQNNIAAYPKWQRWLREHKPSTLVVWGKYDPAFTVAGAEAFKKDLPEADIHILDAGHFAMDTKLDEVASFTRAYMARLPRRR
ncbi:alpha/beta hydrolase (plasmid) [Rhizobium bangladeshense]|uniref:alpha/beta fold hydrolase n=1 Tax=Rhizobium bangladeshense TaxID=1138189 RepID=UPI001A98B458|nr:alpha/beta hydrolase [Rhizobium bangladeshense]QSY98026.1 alpha/beta hydrolase [Rhizobium bangladeshense]